MNIETLKELTGWKRPTINPAPTDLEVALARINADHKSVLVAVKLLTEAVQSNAAGNLNMTVVHEERHKDVLKNMKELKQEMLHADKRHLAAYELAVRPMTRAINDLMDKVNGLNADIHTLKTELHMDREAQARIQNTKLNAIAIRIDDLCQILDNLLKYLGQKLVAPTPGGGRPKGRKTRSPEERFIWLSDKVARAKPGSEAGRKFQRALTRLRNNTGMGA